jgi:hypothetical protein
VSTSSPAIQVRIGPRVSAIHLAIIATVFVLGLVTGFLVAGDSPRTAATHDAPVQRILEVQGPQGHISDMIDLRSQLHGDRFPVRPGH